MKSLLRPFACFSQVLGPGLGLEGPVLGPGLGLEGQVLGPGLGLEGPVLSNITGWNAIILTYLKSDPNQQVNYP